MFVGSYCAPDGSIVYLSPKPSLREAHAVAMAAFYAACERDEVIPPFLYPDPGDPLGLPCFATPNGLQGCIQVEPYPLAYISSYDPSTGQGRMIPFDRP